MITDLFARSRYFIENNLTALLNRPGIFFISVIEPGANPVFTGSDNRALTLSFDDVSPEMFESAERFAILCKEMEHFKRPYRLFSQEQASRIISYVKTAEESPNHITWYVHCTLGVSRSGAIASFIREFCDFDATKFSRHNPHVVPNQLVLTSLRNEWKRSH